MYSVQSGNKRKCDYLDNYNAKYNHEKIKKILKKPKSSNDSDGEEEQETPFDLPSFSSKMVIQIYI